jgi:hypothetical protein
MTMTTDPTRHDAPDPMLEQLFAEARAARPPVSDALMARVLADAAHAMPRATAPVVPRRVPVGQTGWFKRLTAFLGGRPAVAGLAVSALTGVWIGFAQPVALPLALPFDSGVSVTTVELFPAELDLWDEFLAADPASEG